MEKTKQNKLIVALSLGFLLSFSVLGGVLTCKMSSNIGKEENAREITQKTYRDFVPDFKRNETPTDLTDTTWTIHTGWSATSGLGLFNLSGSIVYDSEYSSSLNYEGAFTLGIGYRFDSSEYDLIATANRICYVSTDYSEYSSYTEPSYQYDIILTISGGSSVTNSDLINWLAVNAEIDNPDPDNPITPTYSPIKLNKRYDFRKWYGNVDPLTGCINIALNTDPRYFYDIGSVVIGGNEYTHLQVNLMRATNAINIITGYDFQNSCYLTMGGGDYYGGSTSYAFITYIGLVDSTDLPAPHSLPLYNVPLVGARMVYESGNPISPTDYVNSTGFLCSTFELNETAINWEKYLPSNTKYNYPNIGNDMSVYEVLQLDLYNDTYLDFYSLSSSSTGGNVFDLIKNAFKALVPILSIQLIPGLPIGLLALLPFVAGIIVLVVKVVRK